MYTTQSLRALYATTCIELKCKRNSSVAALLPDAAGANATLTSLDLSLNFVGPAGCKAVVRLAAYAAGLVTLSLRDNQVSNEVVTAMLHDLKEHPTLTTIDLSRNPISHAGGKTLLQLASANANLRHIFIDATLINPALAKRIEDRLELNAAIAEKRLAMAAASSSGARDDGGGMGSAIQTDEHVVVDAAAGARRPRREIPPGEGLSALSAAMSEAMAGDTDLVATFAPFMVILKVADDRAARRRRQEDGAQADDVEDETALPERSDTASVEA